MKFNRPISASVVAAALAVMASASPAGAASLQFNGAASVQVADSPSVSITGLITVEAWINRAQTGAQHSIVEKYGCSGIGGYVLRVTASDKLLFGTRDDCNIGSSVIGVTSIPAGVWTHVAGHWDGATLRVFVNGVADGALAATRNPKDGNSPLKIGERGNGGTPFVGLIDDVRLWSMARTTAQIAAAKDACLTGTEAGLAGYWKMEEGAGATTADATANGNSGALVGAGWTGNSAITCAGAPPPPPPPPAGTTGPALQFNGANASVQIPDSASVSMTGPVTVEAWIKRAATGVQHSIVEKYGCLAGQGGYVLRVTSGDKLMFGTRDDCNNGSSVIGNTTIGAGVWTHVAGHWDGAMLRVFVNGANDGSLAATRNPKDGNTPLKIGERGNGGTPFNGMIDEVRLWSVARTGAQLAGGKDACLAGNETGLMGYWKLDEGAGLMANDATANGNQGACVNALWANPGAPVVCAVVVNPPPPPVVFASLKGVPVPLPANLADVVVDRTRAIQLGKALFWDMQAGGDGLQACASCHFQAGADVRTRNQLNPRASNPATFVANHEMAPGDFPMANGSVMGSQGLRKADFVSIILGSGEDAHTPVADSIFKIPTGSGDVNVRQATGRNTPPAINAVFNFRTFWDGRANNIFNGVNPAGPGDAAARVLQIIGGIPTKVSVAFTNACLASQSVGPPNSSVEMSFNGRNFLQLGKKMLNLTPLAMQHVDATDSVLGGLAAGGQGLTTTYQALIMASFKPEYWNSTAVVDANKNVITPTGALDEFRVIEANFSMFWGLSIMLYESTLVSDDTRVDRFLDGNTGALSPLEQAGMNVFNGKGRCDHCHGLPMTTVATVADAAAGGGAPNPLIGFEIIGVRPLADDGGDILQPGLGAFKIPALRNVELNGPYFHNGGKSTLRQVVEFYNRGGDFLVAGRNSQIRPLGMTDAEMNALVSFLVAMTDERVRVQSAPFDHPELIIHNGSNADGSDNDVDIPATGAAGGAPFQPFMGLSPFSP